MNFSEALTFNDVLLVPKYSEIISRKLVDLSTKFSRNINLKIPLVSSNMDSVTESALAIAMAQLGGIGIIHRFLTIDEQVNQVKEVKALNLLVGAAVGVRDDYLKRAQELIDVGVDVIVIDIAHGHAKHVLDAVKSIKKRWTNIDVVAGNVATSEGVKALVDAGADGVKIGVGSGSACSTRVVTGHGVPQLTAIINCSREYVPPEEGTISIVDSYKPVSVPTIADGGISNSGDIVKSLVAGASCVMLGSLLAGAEECPGYIKIRKGVRYKVYRGMASVEANITRKQKDNITMTEEEISEIVPEGVATEVLYQGKVENIIKQLVGGIKSGFSYSGANNLKELREKAEFIKITAASWEESLPKE